MKNSSFTLWAAALISIPCFLISRIAAAQNWTYVPGIQAQDVAVGKNGSVWATGTNHLIYRWDGSSWQTMPGGGERIAVDPQGAAWTLSLNGDIWKYNLATGGWEQKPGAAKDIGIGADGSVWVIGTGAVQGGYEIFKWTASGWTKIPGGALRIAVDPSGNAWVINSTNTIFHYNGSGWDTKPGGAKDIGVGANGAVWCTAPDYRIFQWDGSNWKLQSGGATQISVAPDGNAWVTNNGGQVYHTTNAASAYIQLPTLYQRGQSYEYRMLQALKVFPYTNMTSGVNAPTYSTLDPFGQIFGKLGLLAAEVYATSHPTATAESLLSDINNFPEVRQRVSGILATLVMAQVTSNSTDAQTTALKKWATDLFRSMKVRCAKGVLDEYQKWKTNPCMYDGEGYKAPVDCGLGSINVAALITSHEPPQDIIAKVGLKSVFTNNADAIASGVAVALAGIVAGGSAAAVVSGLGVLVASGIVNTSATAIPLGFTSLMAAFGGSGGYAATAGAAIGATSWAGVVAAPIAAAVLVVVVGTMEGLKVVEAAKVEPLLKMKLGAAMSEYINLTNAMADSSCAQMFFVAFQESASKGFVITKPNVNGEVRFYNQGGYVAQYRLSYTLNGQNQEFTTPSLSVGFDKTYSIPYNATNIKVQGWALTGVSTWKEIFNLSVAQPTYTCYTSYGTVFASAYKNDCPETNGMTSDPNQLTVTQGGAYVAWVRLEYTNGGQTTRAFDKSDCALGWRQVFSIPATATNIHLTAWSATGLAWDQWRTIIDKSWPSPPNECVKFYNIATDPQWKNECN
jgi:tectonin-like protein